MGLFSRNKKSIDHQINAFTSGTVIPLKDVPDQVFAQGYMGEGVAIEPTDNNIYAPCDGVLTVVFPTGHAYGISREDGVELLVHLGIDTVELNGQGFTVLVKKGDKVKRGDKLAIVDWDFIKSQGKSTISPLIVTSGQAITITDIPQITPTIDDFIKII
ncbi:PTS glucose transporter subunit IIA [Erysipelothrix sp. HDW6C]|uniref:PTS sugar transporter subunit IIA n=1 Tax=Erysipelothrix sp. HDW6C TaxID=2714930 RepID=UPI00140CFD06|nr:PTS glucose transporter subunit IIA [Erysipelothrix sp. HDW6C]QIK69568.1 PTS glucose transporter subunit IIA [Erysipelothrix sp. HDW6C]